MNTRIFKNGLFYIFQDQENLDRINTLNIAETTYDVSGGRHYFKQVRSGKLTVIYSFPFARILNQHGVAYDSPEALNTELSKRDEGLRSDQVIHRLVSAVSTNDTLIRTGEVRLFGAVLTNDAAGTLYVKYYNKATEPVVGTDIPVLTLAVKTKETINIDLGQDGLLFDKGLGIGVSGAIPDADATDTGANEMFASSMIDNADFFYESMLGVINGVGSTAGILTASGALVGASNGSSSTTSVLIDQP